MAKNVFINWINAKAIHTNKTADGKEFCNVSIPSDKSVTGFATVAVNCGQILPCTKKDGTEMADYRNVLLGAEGKTHKVSICTKKATAKKPAVYNTVDMLNEDIVEMINNAKKAYRAAQKQTETAAE